MRPSFTQFGNFSHNLTKIEHIWPNLTKTQKKGENDKIWQNSEKKKFVQNGPEFVQNGPEFVQNGPEFVQNAFIHFFLSNCVKFCQILSLFHCFPNFVSVFGYLVKSPQKTQCVTGVAWNRLKWPETGWNGLSWAQMGPNGPTWAQICPFAVLSWRIHHPPRGIQAASAQLKHQLSPCAGPPSTTRHSSSLCSARTFFLAMRGSTIHQEAFK